MISKPFRLRSTALDGARGLALIAMAGYHFTWDLAHFGFVDDRLPYASSFRLFSHAIASSFLCIAGISLVLAHRNGFDPRAFAKRLAIIAGAAALVTIGSEIAFPDGVIWFGILHCIAMASILAIPLLIAPWWIAFLAAGIAIALPVLFTGPIFNAPIVQWIGLNTIDPNSNDFRPLLPWAAALFLGVGGEKIFTRTSPRSTANTPAPATRALALGGRHSLIIYLVHQPILIGALMAWIAIFGVPAEKDERPFRDACEAQCTAPATQPGLCSIACACTARAMKGVGLWPKLLTNSLDEPERRILGMLANECAAKLK